MLEEPAVTLEVEAGICLAIKGVGGDMTKPLLPAASPPALFSLACPVEISLRPLDDDLIDPVGVGAIGALRRVETIQACRSPDWGLSRFSGSQVKHFDMKSIKSSSSHFRAEASVLVPGRRRLPFTLTKGRGAPVASVYLRSIL